jgi:hypothetical protein
LGKAMVPVAKEREASKCEICELSDGVGRRKWGWERGLGIRTVFTGAWAVCEVDRRAAAARKMGAGMYLNVKSERIPTPYRVPMCNTFL